MPVNRVDSIKELIPAMSNTNSRSSWAKKLLLNVFEGIQDGRLIIVDGKDVYEFGESAAEAEVTAHIDVHDPQVYGQVISNGITGSAEAYMLGMWSSSSPLNVVRLMVRNMEMLDTMNGKRSWLKSQLLKVFAKLHSNDLQGSKRNISAHYDLGNEFFKLFLDETMMYSSAVYPHDQADLKEAAVHKLDLICQKLDLKPEHHVVEIGTGWGGFACYAAQHYGCKVTTTTISKKQYEEAVARVDSLGLSDQVTVLFQDYRELKGQYDKLVSIEMIEAVGHEFYAEYFNQCASLLKPDGQMLIQAILMNDQRYEQARKSVDFIKRYIFPGGCLPSYTEISKQVCEQTDLQLMNVQDITYDYAKTLADWRQAFLAKLDDVKAQGYSEIFIRMWEFYLCYCQGGFMERTIHTAQLLYAKPQWRDGRYPVCN